MPHPPRSQSPQPVSSGALQAGAGSGDARALQHRQHRCAPLPLPCSHRHPRSRRRCADWRMKPGWCRNGCGQPPWAQRQAVQASRRWTCSLAARRPAARPRRVRPPRAVLTTITPRLQHARLLAALSRLRLSSVSGQCSEIASLSRHSVIQVHGPARSWATGPQRDPKPITRNAQCIGHLRKAQAYGAQADSGPRCARPAPELLCGGLVPMAGVHARVQLHSTDLAQASSRDQGSVQATAAALAPTAATTSMPARPLGLVYGSPCRCRALEIT